MNKVLMQKTGDWQGYYLVDESGVCTGKTCSMCRDFKDLLSFHKSSNRKFGAASRCKECTSSYSKEWANIVLDSGLTKDQAKKQKTHETNTLRTDEQILLDQARLRPSGTKTCRTCKSVLPLTEFNECRSWADGLQFNCKTCGTNDLSRRYYIPSSTGVGARGAELRRLSYKKAGERSPDQVLLDRAQRHPTGSKPCGYCGSMLPIDLFYNNRVYGDGLDWICMECRKADVKARMYRDVETQWVDRGVPLECYVCAEPWLGSHHVDHVISRRLGGTDDPMNLLPMCPAHNTSKWCWPLEVWLRNNIPESVSSILEKVSSYGVDFNVPVGSYSGLEVFTDDQGVLHCARSI